MRRLSGWPISAGLLEQFGAELFREIRIFPALVDQDRAGKARTGAQQFAGIVPLPLLAIGAEIQDENLAVAPGHARGRRDR